MGKKALNSILTALLAVAIIIFTITFSIGLPIYVRPFYYAHTDALEMPEDTGWSRETIIEAYDEILDYLTLPGREYGAGELEVIEEEAAHFADCKVLFNLNLVAFIIASVVIVVLTLLHKRGIIELSRARGYNVCLWSGVGTLSLFAILAAVVSIDFDAAFYVFHRIFFPGKDNWQFGFGSEVIQIMREEFFMNCAILIVSSIILISLVLIVVGVLDKRRENRSK